jgi:integrase
MNRTQLMAIIVGITALISLLCLWTSGAVFSSVLFIFPLILCVRQHSRWLLWATAAIATGLTVAPEIWAFHHGRLLNPWLSSVNSGLVIANLLTLTTLGHLWISKRRQAMLGAGEMESHSKSLAASIEQLESELAKIKAINRGKRNPPVLTIKQYQALAGQLSDLHRTMVVAAMCTGMRVSEVLALRWSQLDLASGMLSLQQGAVNERSAELESEAPAEQIPMDPVLVEALLEWRSKSPGAGLVFPSHITGRCYHPGPIQQNYFRPVARKLGLAGVCWNTFPHSYRSWIDEEGTSAGVQQKLLRHAKVSTITSTNKRKPKAKVPNKPVQRVVPNGGSGVGVSAEGF